MEKEQNRQHELWHCVDAVAIAIAIDTSIDAIVVCGDAEGQIELKPFYFATKWLIFQNCLFM